MLMVFTRDKRAAGHRSLLDRLMGRKRPGAAAAGTTEAAAEVKPEELPMAYPRAAE